MMKEEIYAGLGKLGAFEPCPRCRHNSFEVLEGYAEISLQPELSLSLQEPYKTKAALSICSNCGYIAMHQLSKVISSAEKGESVSV